MAGSRPTLSKEQRNIIKQLLAEREPYKAIADRVGCSVPTIDYYAKKFSSEIDNLQSEYDRRFFERGLRARLKRLERLEELARLHEAQLLKEAPSGQPIENGGLYYTEVKVASNGDEVNYRVYNKGMVAQYLAILDQIAKELGQLPAKSETQQANAETVVRVIYGEAVADG